MKAIFLLWFFWLTLSAQICAQEYAFELWHEGKVVLESGDTLKGKVKYDMQTDLVQVNIADRYESFTARKVLLFEIFDVTVSRYRKIYSLPYATSGSYKAPVFFELLEEGKITLLSRETLEYRTIPSSYYFYGTTNRLVVVYKYFTLKENGDIIPFMGKRNDWLEMMKDRKQEIQKYVKARKLDFDEKYHLSTIIAYYNSLFVK